MVQTGLVNILTVRTGRTRCHYWAAVAGRSKGKRSQVSDLPKPLHHVLLLLAVGAGVEDEPPGEVRLVVAHEDVLVLDVLEHQQHVSQLGLHLVTRQALGEGRAQARGDDNTSVGKLLHLYSRPIFQTRTYTSLRCNTTLQRYF